MKFLFLLTFFILTYSFKNNLFINKIIKKSLFINNNFNPKYCFIFFPGFGIKPESYNNLCNLINYKTFNNSNFLILNYQYMSALDINFKTDEISKNAIDFLKNNNIKYEKLFFIGHSAGAYYAINPAEKYSDGLIVMGCVLNSKGELFWNKKSLKNYNKPVLTLLGQKDGYINFLNSIQEFNDLDKKDFLKKPIIIYDNINHLQMSNNEPTIYSKIFNKKDYHSSLTLNEAHEILSDTIVSFINKNISVYFNSYDSYIKINEYLNLNNDIDKISKYSQYKIFNSINNFDFNINNTIIDNFYDFILSKPYIDHVSNVHIFTYLGKTFFNNLFSKSLFIKMKNQQALKSNYLFSNVLTDRSITASEINKYIIDTYFNDSCPLNIIYEEDLFYDSSKWIFSEISVRYINDKLYIKSPVLYTNEYTIPRYSGMIYMKLLSPQMVSEIKSLYY